MTTILLLLSAVIALCGVQMTSATGCSEGYVQTSGTAMRQPLDVCLESSTGGTAGSTKYQCSGSSGEMKMFFSSSCSGSAATSSMDSATVVCGNCNSFVHYRSYFGCSASDDFMETAFVTDDCVTDGTNSQIYTCTDSSFTLTSYSGSTTCSGTSTSATYDDGACDTILTEIISCGRTSDSASAGNRATGAIAGFAIIALLLAVFAV